MSCLISYGLRTERERGEEGDSPGPPGATGRRDMLSGETGGVQQNAQAREGMRSRPMRWTRSLNGMWRRQADIQILSLGSSPGW